MDNQNQKQDFAEAVRNRIASMESELTERNQDIAVLDSYIYGDRLSKDLDIPIGHDKTVVNWLRRVVEIHRDQFMGRGFVMTSSYDSDDPSRANDDDERGRIKIENAGKKQRAESRRRFSDAIIKDNGGFALFKNLAENAGASGFSVIKAWYDEKAKKYVLSPIESVENFVSVWSSDNFRDSDLDAFIYQVSEQTALDRWGVKKATTSPRGQTNSPLSQSGSSVDASTTQHINDVTLSQPVDETSSQPMVTVMELTGKLTGWKAEKGKMVKTTPGNETLFNAVIVDRQVKRVISDEKKLPKYYVLPNKLQRRRAWGKSDVTQTMIELNKTYVQTLSDWRTVGHKVNFPKFRMFGFDPDSQLPKFEPREIQGIPLGEGQDIVRIDQGDASVFDFNKQMEEIKEQFVREAGVSRVLFDDPSVELNSNQALTTALKPTTDIAEAKKVLWAPVLAQLFEDALQVVAQFDKNLKELADGDEDWHFEVKWPSTMAKEDPVFQQMLLNRFNSNTISLQTFLEEQGETKEEIDRIRDEMEDPLTAALLSRQLALMAQGLLAPPGQPEPKVSVSLRGDLTPYQEANLASQQGFNDGPYPPTAGPQGQQGRVAQENADNKGFLEGNPFNGGTPIQQSPEGQVIATQANNQEGQQPVSQPGSGATPVSPQGKINQTVQNAGG